MHKVVLFLPEYEALCEYMATDEIAFTFNHLAEAFIQTDLQTNVSY